MENMPLLITVVIAFMIAFILGIFYIRKQLEKGANFAKVVFIPLLIFLGFAVTLLIIGIGGS